MRVRVGHVRNRKFLTERYECGDHVVVTLFGSICWLVCVCVCVFLLYSVQLGGQRSPLSTTALMVYLAHS